MEVRKSEGNTINKSVVAHFQFSEELKSIRIISRPQIEIQTKTNFDTIDYRNLGDYELVLYPPAEKLKDIIESLEKCFDWPVTRMD